MRKRLLVLALLAAGLASVGAAVASAAPQDGKGDAACGHISPTGSAHSNGAVEFPCPAK